MKRVILGFLLSFFVLRSSAQKIYFVYLQSESETPFIVKMNDKVYPSSASGYIVLPRLRDSTYYFRIGFPNNKWPEQQFTISMHAADHGFLLKNFADKGGWGLFDLQTATVIMAGQGSASFRTEPRQVSAFTEVLSAAADDPSLKVKTIPLETKKPESIATEVAPVATATNNVVAVQAKVTDSAMLVTSKKKADSIVVKDSAIAATIPVVTKPVVTTAKDSVQSKPVVETAVTKEIIQPENKSDSTAITQASYSPSKVTRKSESSNSEGLGVVYTDDYNNGKKDTVRITIPNPKAGTVVLEEKKQVVAANSGDKKILDDKAKEHQQEVSGEKSEEKKTTAVAVPSSDKSARAVSKPSSSNPSCNALASEKDYSKLKKKLVEARTEDDMLNEAKKSFDTRCYSTEQIKALGSLFLREPARFQFYEAAYPHNSDRENFVALQEGFKDPYFIHRFKNLVN